MQLLWLHTAPDSAWLDLYAPPDGKCRRSPSGRRIFFWANFCPFLYAMPSWANTQSSHRCANTLPTDYRLRKSHPGRLLVNCRWLFLRHCACSAALTWAPWGSPWLWGASARISRDRKLTTCSTDRRSLLVWNSCGSLWISCCSSSGFVSCLLALVD